jgi:DNA helicase-2/ATP-dependent DNA helicase PcrA
MIDFEMAPSGKSGPTGFDPFSSDPGASLPGNPRASKIPAFVDALNDRQREAVLHTEGPLIVIAGAGSGKTKMLTSRIAYLVETGRARPYEVLAMTFTNKAAGEMRERVERTLAHPAADGMPSNALGTPEIGTFHSVCVRLLRREAAATPFTKPFVIYDDSDQLVQTIR